MPDPRKLIAFDDRDSIEAIRQQVTLELRKAERASTEFRELLADDRAALTQLATLGASGRVQHDLLVLALDAFAAEITAKEIG